MVYYANVHRIVNYGIIIRGTFSCSVRVLGEFTKLRKATIILVMSVFLSASLSIRLFICASVWNNSAPLDGFSLNLMFYPFFEKLSR